MVINGWKKYALKHIKYIEYFVLFTAKIIIFNYKN